MRKRILSWLLLGAMLLGMLPTVGLAAVSEPSIMEDERWKSMEQITKDCFTSGNTYTLSCEGDEPCYKICDMKDLTDKYIVIPAGKTATLYLNNVQMSGKKSPIQVQENATLTIVVVEGSANTLTCTTKTAEEVTTNSASNLTAGISVPENATLIIQGDGAGTGSLTIQGGFGGAGIGTGAATGYVTTGKAGGSGADGGTGYKSAIITDQSQSVNQDITRVNGLWQDEVKLEGNAGGAGGAGGKYGADAKNAGTVTITGGDYAPGIGGGMGVSGENGKPGQKGSYGSAADVRTADMSGNDAFTGQGNTSTDGGSTLTYVAGPGGTGGSGGGGAGGNGGKGGT